MILICQLNITFTSNGKQKYLQTQPLRNINTQKNLFDENQIFNFNLYFQNFTLQCIMSQYSRTHFKRFCSKCRKVFKVCLTKVNPVVKYLLQVNNKDIRIKFMVTRDCLTPITSNAKRLKRLEVAIGSLLLTLDKCLLLWNILIHCSS